MAELTDIPTQSEYSQWLTDIATQQDPATNQPVWNSGQLIVAVGTTVDGRTWAEINAQLTEYLKTAPPLGVPVT